MILSSQQLAHNEIMRQRHTELGKREFIMQKSIFYTVVLLIVLVVGGLAGCSGFKSNQAVTHYNKGVELNEQGRYDEAIAEYNKAIEINPNYTNAYINRGYAYLMKKQYDIAITDYTKVIKLDPDNKTAYNGRGAAYLYTKQFALALLDYNKSINLDPNQDQIYKNIDYCNKMLTSEILTGEWVSNDLTPLLVSPLVRVLSLY